MDPAAPGMLGVWRDTGQRLSEPSKGGEHAQSCRNSAKGGRAGAAGSGDTAEGLLPGKRWELPFGERIWCVG